MRPVTANDFDTVYDIYMDESVIPFMLHEPCSRHEFHGIFNDLMKRDYFWLFEDNGESYGMCGVIRGKGRMGHVAMLIGIAVKNEFQGLGLGMVLLDKVVEQLKKDGFTRIELQCESDNKISTAFYQKMGFSIDGYHKKAFKRANDNEYIDEIFMSQIF